MCDIRVIPLIFNNNFFLNDPNNEHIKNVDIFIKQINFYSETVRFRKCLKYYEILAS